MSKKQTEIIARGLVQGVTYRYNTQKKAEELGLIGWVRNEQDGTVKIIVQGEEEDLQKLIDWCKNGPEFAKVEEIVVNWQKPTEEFKSFEIKY